MTWRILVTNFGLAGLGGSETYTYSLCTELQRRGHHVEVFTLHEGLVSQRLREAGIPCHTSLTGTEGFDLLHLHHATPALVAHSRFPDTPMVFVSHGVLPREEHPPPALVPTIARFVAVSPETRNHLTGLGIAPSRIAVIPNGIDSDRFRPETHPRNDPDVLRVLVMTYLLGEGKRLAETLWRLGDLSTHLTVAGHGNQTLLAAAASLGLPLKNAGQVWEIERLIHQSDLVVATGRGVMEAMSCGKPVLVWGQSGTDGILTRKRLDRIAACNFSGRAFRHRWDPSRIAASIRVRLTDAKWLGDVPVWSRKLAVERFSLRAMVDRLELEYQAVLSGSS